MTGVFSLKDTKTGPEGPAGVEHRLSGDSECEHASWDGRFCEWCGAELNDRGSDA